MTLCKLVAPGSVCVNYHIICEKRLTGSRGSPSFRPPHEKFVKRFGRRSCGGRCGPCFNKKQNATHSISNGVLKTTSFSNKDNSNVSQSAEGLGLYRFLWVSMQRMMYSLEQLRVCWPRSRPEVRLDDWPVTDMWSARHVSQCLSTTLRPLLVEPCQMLLYGLTGGGQKMSTQRGHRHKKHKLVDSRPSVLTRRGLLKHCGRQRRRWALWD